MAVTYRDRYKCGVTNTPLDTDDYIIGAPATNFVAFNALDDNLNFSIVVSEGADWEIADGCVYTHSTTTLSRGTLVNSNTYPLRPTFTSACSISVTLLSKDIVTSSVGSTAAIKQYGRNASGGPIAMGSPVYLVGSTGAYVTIAPASNTSENTSSKMVGIAAENIANNAVGFVQCDGLLENVNTSTATEGDAIWLGPNGTLIYGLANKPVAPLHLVFIGIVVKRHASTGSIFVKVANGWEIEELHDVLITSPANNDILRYDSSIGVWKNNTLADKQATLVSGTNIKTINSVSLLGPGNIDISGGGGTSDEFDSFFLMGA